MAIWHIAMQVLNKVKGEDHSNFSLEVSCRPHTNSALGQKLVWSSWGQSQLNIPWYKEQTEDTLRAGSVFLPVCQTTGADYCLNYLFINYLLLSKHWKLYSVCALAPVPWKGKHSLISLILSSHINPLFYPNIKHTEMLYKLKQFYCNC